MLVNEEELVKADGESGRESQAYRDGGDDDRDARDAGPALPQAEPLQVVAGTLGHDQSDEAEQERERDRVAGVEQTDPGRAARDLDGRRQDEQAEHGQHQRDPRAASTA